MEPCQRDQNLIERATRTLQENLFTDNEYPWHPYRCLSPDIRFFDGIWNWDSAFHALGIAYWDRELAKESILGFLKFQRPDGLLPDVIHTDGRIVSDYSKPPVFAWAAEQLYRQDGDKEFLKTIYPALVGNLNYWREHRCENGLYYYNSDDKDNPDYLLHVRYESGWDNSVRWDHEITDFYPIDLNCFMVMFFRSMAFIAGEIGKAADGLLWHRQAEATSALINQRLWCPEKEFYADAYRSREGISDVLSPACFMPLFIGIADERQADCMRRVAETAFEGKMPTVSFDNPAYSNDYWRGPTWLNVAYFAAKGLKNYGFSVADTIRENILNMCYEEKDGIFENYDSRTGKGLCCDHFSWSCTFILEFIKNW